MFREMRRKKQELSTADSIAVLTRGSSGVLAVSGDDGYPYAVPLSYIYDGNKIYFHCAKSGHKLDAIARDSKVSFCVTDKDTVVPEKFTTHFRSVIVFGRARVLEDEEEIRSALEMIAMKYSPDHMHTFKQELDGQLNKVCLIELAIEHMTGKEALELVNAKNKT